MGEEKPDEELMGKRKSSPRLSTASRDADKYRMPRTSQDIPWCVFSSTFKQQLECVGIETHKAQPQVCGVFKSEVNSLAGWRCIQSDITVYTYAIMALSASGINVALARGTYALPKVVRIVAYLVGGAI